MSTYYPYPIYNMDNGDRRVLVKNRVKLVDFFGTNPSILNRVCDELLAGGTLTPHMLANVKKPSSDEYQRGRCLLDVLPRRGPGAMTAFLRALGESAATDIINAVRRTETTPPSNLAVPPPSTSTTPPLNSAVPPAYDDINAARRTVATPSTSSAPPSYADPPPTYEQACIDEAIERSLLESSIPTSSRRGGLSEYVITSEDCVKLAGMIGMRWALLGVALNLDYALVERIGIDNAGNCRKAIMDTLEAWRS